MIDVAHVRKISAAELDPFVLRAATKRLRVRRLRCGSVTKLHVRPAVGRASGCVPTPAESAIRHAAEARARLDGGHERGRADDAPRLSAVERLVRACVGRARGVRHDEAVLARERAVRRGDLQRRRRDRAALFVRERDRVAAAPREAVHDAVVVERERRALRVDVLRDASHGLGHRAPRFPPEEERLVVAHADAVRRRVRAARREADVPAVRRGVVLAGQLAEARALVRAHTRRKARRVVSLRAAPADVDEVVGPDGDAGVRALRDAAFDRRLARERAPAVRGLHELGHPPERSAVGRAARARAVAVAVDRAARVLVDAARDGAARIARDHHGVAAHRRVDDLAAVELVDLARFAERAHVSDRDRPDALGSVARDLDRAPSVDAVDRRGHGRLAGLVNRRRVRGAARRRERVPRRVEAHVLLGAVDPERAVPRDDRLHADARALRDGPRHAVVLRPVEALRRDDEDAFVAEHRDVDDHAFTPGDLHLRPRAPTVDAALQVALTVDDDDRALSDGDLTRTLHGRSGLRERSERLAREVHDAARADEAIRSICLLDPDDALGREHLRALLVPGRVLDPALAAVTRVERAARVELHRRDAAPSLRERQRPLRRRRESRSRRPRVDDERCRLRDLRVRIRGRARKNQGDENQMAAEKHPARVAQFSASAAVVNAGSDARAPLVVGAAREMARRAIDVVARNSIDRPAVDFRALRLARAARVRRSARVRVRVFFVVRPAVTISDDRRRSVRAGPNTRERQAKHARGAPRNSRKGHSTHHNNNVRRLAKLSNGQTRLGPRFQRSSASVCAPAKRSTASGTRITPKALLQAAVSLTNWA